MKVGISTLRMMPLFPYMHYVLGGLGGFQIQTSCSTDNKCNSSNVTRNKEHARRLAQIKKAKLKQLDKK